MFGSIGGGEILMILALALLLFGPRKLPQIGKTLGKTLAEFRRATYDLKASLEQEVALEEIKEVKRVKDDVQSAGREIADAVSAANPLGVARGALDEPSAPATGPGPGVDNEADADGGPASDDSPKIKAPDAEVADHP